MNNPQTAPEIEAIYNLTPLQKGILFHVAATPDRGLYVTLLAWRIKGLDAAAFERAWRYLLERHAVLRTSVVWQEIDEPLQVVQAGLPLPWRQLDWEGLDAEEQNRRLEDLAQAERKRIRARSRPFDAAHSRAACR